MKPKIINFNEDEEEALGKMEEITGKKGERELSLVATDGFTYVIEPFKTLITKKGVFEYGASVYKIGRGHFRLVNIFTGKTLSEPSPVKLVENMQIWATETSNGVL